MALHALPILASRLNEREVLLTVAGGVFELCLQHALERRTRELPQIVTTASYFALAPFIGSRDAARIAKGAAPVRAG